MTHGEGAGDKQDAINDDLERVKAAWEDQNLTPWPGLDATRIEEPQEDAGDE